MEGCRGNGRKRESYKDIVREEQRGERGRLTAAPVLRSFSNLNNDLLYPVLFGAALSTCRYFFYCCRREFLEASILSMFQWYSVKNLQQTL